VLFNALPFFDAGVVVILFTVLVKFVLFPLSRKSLVAQAQMKRIEPELSKIRDKHKNDKQEQARRTMELYKEKKINPFSGIFLILIQLPIVFALYFVFLKSGLPQINEDLLYSFVPKPGEINMNLLGLVDISQKSYILAFLAGISSFFQIRFSVPAYKKTGEERSFKTDLARSMNMQMRYFFPVIVFFISYNISGAIALYWFTSNIFTLIQEWIIKRKLNDSQSTTLNNKN
jgi:YidC/Oxa1 family membrane protein insertase